MPRLIHRFALRTAVVAVLLFFLPLDAIAEDLRFPLSFRNSITSTFGEYRIGHPHAGLDFSTGLQNGVHVLAADSGSIIQIKVSYFGYGRALYQRTSDGRVLVYAHLSGFSPKIDAIAKSIQKQNGRYSFARFFAPGEIPVQAGETIAYSGDTGTDIPHLHFEVRDTNNVTLNPLLNGLSIKDTIAPVIKKLHAVPLNYDAHVEGSWQEKTYTFKKNPDGSYGLGAPCRIGGKVGLSVEVTDYADGTPRMLNPYMIELQIDYKRKFLIRFDRFDYNMRYVSELNYDYRLKETRCGSFHRLFRLYENTVFHPEPLSGDLSELEPGQHTATLTATDANGNSSRAQFILLINAPPRIRSVQFNPVENTLGISVKTQDSDGQVTRVSVARKVGNGWEDLPAPARGKGLFHTTLSSVTEPTFFRIFATDDAGDKSPPYFTTFSSSAPDSPMGEINAKHSVKLRGSVVSLLLLRNAGFTHSPDVRVLLDPPAKTSKNGLDFVLYQEPTAIRINAQVPDDWPGGTMHFDGTFKDAQGIPYFGQWSVPLQIASPKGSIVGSADGQAQMIFLVGGPYAPVPCIVERKILPAPTWLENISAAYLFSQEWEPMRKEQRVSIAIPEGTQKLQGVGLYLFDRGVWWYMGNERSRNKVAARVKHMGTFALMRDISAPDIGDIKPSGVVANLKPTIEIKVSDAGAGLFGGGIDFKLDGVSRIVEWHPIHGWLRYVPEKPLPVGTHKVVVTLTDKAGNTSTRSGTFTISM